MPKFAANLGMMFNEVPLLARFAKAAQAGFAGVEIQFPYDHSTDELVSRLRENNLQLVLFNMPSGSWEKNERGLASIPGREQEFIDHLDLVRQYANALDCRKVHMMAGVPPDGVTPQRARDTFVQNLKDAARICRADGITILIEPINLHDMPGYFLNYQAQALDLIKAAAEPNIALQMDFYHCQIMEGDLARHLRDNIEHIAHIQIAGVPGRHEPDRGEINYPFLYDLIDELGYRGWIGCEYRPAADTQAGLGWASDFLSG
jgi:hydroxypyruvate isomerase